MYVPGQIVLFEHQRVDSHYKKMKNNLFLLLGSTIITLLVSLGLIRWFAPHLVGITPSLKLVKVSEEVPPFYDNIFRPSDYGSDKFIIEDPYLNRAKPLYPDNVFLDPMTFLDFAIVKSQMLPI